MCGVRHSFAFDFLFSLFLSLFDFTSFFLVFPLLHSFSFLFFLLFLFLTSFWCLFIPSFTSYINKTCHELWRPPNFFTAFSSSVQSPHLFILFTSFYEVILQHFYIFLVFTQSPILYSPPPPTTLHSHHPSRAVQGRNPGVYSCTRSLFVFRARQTRSVLWLWNPHLWQY